MIIDAQGRKWAMRFRQRRDGWHWEAWHENFGQSSCLPLASKALAEADARAQIQNHDTIAEAVEYFRRLRSAPVRGWPELGSVLEAQAMLTDLARGTTTGLFSLSKMRSRYAAFAVMPCA
jgi:hypothetical protein